MDLSESQREDKPEGPTLQTMPSEQIRTYLINTFKVLSKSASIINPEANKVNKIYYNWYPMKVLKYLIFWLRGHNTNQAFYYILILKL